MKHKIDKKKFINSIEKKLELPSNSLSNTKNLQTNEDWDSLSKMTFISIMQKQFKTEVDPDKLLKCKTTDDLYRLLK
jgi:acyl carrier protein